MAERLSATSVAVGHYLRLGLSLARTALTEFLLVCRAAWVQSRKLTVFGWAYGRKWALGRRRRHAMHRLGECAVDMGAGDETLRASIAELNTQERLSNEQRRRRRQLIDRLAVSVLEGATLDDSPAARRVVELQGRMKECERDLQDQLGALVPVDPGQRRRAAVGMAALAVSGLVLLGRTFTAGQSASAVSERSPTAALEPDVAARGAVTLRTELGFFTRDEPNGKVIVDCVTAGGQAVAAGMRLGDQILAVGREPDSFEEIKKTSQIGRYVSPIGDKLYVKFMRNTAAEPVVAQLTWGEQTPPDATASLKFKDKGYEFLIPWTTRDRFFKLGKEYEYVTNQSGLMGRPNEYVGKRIAVITELLFPEITPTRINLRLFDTMNSPQVHVEPGRDEGLFKAIVENDPIKHPYVLMHVELRRYGDTPALYGKLEEIMFLSPGAVDACKPLNENYYTAAENRWYEEQKKKREEAASRQTTTAPADAPQLNPLLTGSGSSPTAGSEGSPLPWNEVESVLGSDKLESGLRCGRRFVLESGRLMLIDGEGVLHVLASPQPEGRASLQLFVQSRLFSPEEQTAVASLVAEGKPASARVGRFDVSIDATSDRVLELPKHWLRLDMRLASGSDKPIGQPSLVGSGAFAADELYTLSRYRRVNKVIREALISKVEPDEVDLQVRTFDNLVEAAGLTATAAYDHLDSAIQTTQNKGLPRSVAVDAAISSLSFRVALCEDQLSAKFKRP